MTNNAKIPLDATYNEMHTPLVDSHSKNANKDKLTNTNGMIIPSTNQSTLLFFLSNFSTTSFISFLSSNDSSSTSKNLQIASKLTSLGISLPFSHFATALLDTNNLSTNAC